MVIGLFCASVNDDVASVLATTVEYNINEYTVIEYSGAKNAHAPQNIMSRPSTKGLIN